MRTGYVLDNSSQLMVQNLVFSSFGSQKILGVRLALVVCLGYFLSFICRIVSFFLIFILFLLPVERL